MLHGVVFVRTAILRVFILLPFLFALALAGCGESGEDINIGADSAIQLVERSDEGAYRFRSITIMSLEGKATVFEIIDDESVDFPLDTKEYESLWSFAQERKVNTMEDAPLENAFPGQSQFQFSFRIGSDENRFTAYGVDYLTDTRYRELARRIIEIVDSGKSDTEGPL